MTTELVQLQLHRDTAANWASVNPILLAGEPGVEIDTGKGKVGNGTSHWNDMNYPYADQADLAAAIASVTFSPTDVDSVTKRVTADLVTWNAWLVNSGVAGVLEESGWPNTTDSQSWNALSDRYFRQLFSKGIPSCTATSGRLVTSGNILGAYTSSTLNTDLDTVKANARMLEKFTASPSIFRGVSVTGGEAGADANQDGLADTLSAGQKFSNLFPGVVNTDYAYPSANDFLFLARRGVTVVNMSFRWERLQPTLMAALNATEVTRITTALNNAAAAGVKVVLKCHNLSGYFIGSSSTVSTFTKIMVNPVATVSMAMFADFWGKMSAAFGSHQALYGYSLMNKPSPASEVVTTGSELVVNTGFETDTSGWAGFGGTPTTIARDTTVFHTGAASLKLTANGTVYAGAVQTAAVSVVAASVYLVSTWFRAATVARSVTIQVDWHDSGGTFLSSSYPAFVTETVGSWVQVSGTVTAPTGAVTANLTPRTDVTIPPTSEVHNIDDVTVFLVSGSFTSSQAWEQISQAAVTAIRANDLTHEIWIQGINNSTTGSLPTSHSVPWITDSAGKTRYAARQYFDIAGGSLGAYALSYSAENAAAVTAGF